MALEDDSKKLAIIEAGFAAFTSYGYKRTTMDDIAQAAGMSRPAVYQHFRNKEAIFRAYGENMRDRFLKLAEEKLRQGPTVADALASAFDSAFIEPHRILSNTPHGIELVEMKSSVAQNLFADWLRGMETVIAAWLGEAARAGTVNLRGAEPGDYAGLLVNAVEGIKARNDGMDRAERELQLLASMAAASLSP